LRAVHVKLASEGLDFKMQVCANNAKMLPPEIQSDSRFLTLDRPKREDFWNVLKHTHVFLSFSREEELPFSLMEAVHFGTPGVVVREDWSVDMFGPDYPWFVEDVTQAYAYLKWIHKNRVRAWEKFTDWYRNFFLPEIVRKRGNAQERFEHESQKWYDTNEEKDFRLKAEKSEVVQALHKTTKKKGVVDLLNLPDDSGLRQLGDVRTGPATRLQPYYRRPTRWIYGYYLRAFYGWESTKKPWHVKKD
jgi:hypothetical protein